MPKFVHVEIPATDLRRAKTWYSKIFGWTFQDMDKDYALIMDGGDSIGGLWRSDRALPRPDWRKPMARAYVSVDDLAATLKAIKRARGVVLKDKEEVPGFGWWAAFADPQGCVLYLWESMRKAAAAPAGEMTPAMNLEEGREVSAEARMLKT